MARKNFESAMDRLEKIVQSLEAEAMPLEDALKVFEEGMQLVNFCSSELESAEKKVAILTRDGNGNIREVPFDALGEKNDRARSI